MHARSAAILERILERADDMPGSLRLLLFAAVAVAGVIALIAIVEPLGAPGDLSVFEAPQWDPTADRLRAALELEPSDPRAAIALLRGVLRAIPNHLVAMEHLARSLERTGSVDEARALRERALRLSEAASEAEGGLAVRPIFSPKMSEEALMAAGLAALYKRREPASAIPAFQRVLIRNPDHYGATFQLAMARESAGQLREARPLWEKVIVLSARFRDAPTGDLARGHITSIDAALQQ